VSAEIPFALSPPARRATRLRRALAEGPLLLAPGAYDCISARLIDQAGFETLYVTGSGVSLSALGAPDVGLMSFQEVLDRVKRIADSVSIPVIADADTGYGGPLNVIRTVRELEQAGVAAIQLEDQRWPKRCGHEPGRRLVGVDEMAGRLRAAVDARRDPDTLIIARTDARSELGIDAAIERSGAYVDAGADAIFVESPETREEMRLVTAAIQRPTLANMVEGGRTPILPAAELDALGFRLAIYPNALTRAFAHAGSRLLASLIDHGDTSDMRESMLTHGELWALFDYASWTDCEARYTNPPTVQNHTGERTR